MGHRFLIDGDRVPEDARRAAERIRNAYRGVAPPSPSLGLLDGDDLADREAARVRGEDARAAWALEHWLVQAHAYSEQEAMQMGIFGRLFSGQVDRVKGGVSHEAKRYSIVQSEELGRIEVGVAVRLSVATSSLSAEAELTIPNLAAQAHLGQTEARVGISVTGFTGFLGDLLPSPEALDVETYASYMASFREIQKVVFGREGLPFIAPVELSFDFA